MATFAAFATAAGQPQAARLVPVPVHSAEAGALPRSAVHEQSSRSQAWLLAPAALAAGALSRKQKRRTNRPAAAAISGAGVAAGLSEAEVEKVQEDRKKSGGGRPKVVVLGSGWGAATFIKGLSEETAKLYDITVVSPRNFFLYTPLLPACTWRSAIRAMSGY